MATSHEPHVARIYAEEVTETIATLEARHGAENAPIGGWRNQAVALIAERHLLNPYALDRMIRGRV